MVIGVADNLDKERVVYVFLYYFLTKAKSTIILKPVLLFLDDNLSFQVEVDSSDFATGVVLSQQFWKGKKLHTVAFYFKSLNVIK